MRKLPGSEATRKRLEGVSSAHQIATIADMKQNRGFAFELRQRTTRTLMSC